MWILTLIFLSATGVVSTSKATYPSRSACEAAGHSLTSPYAPPQPSYARVFYACQEDQ